MKKKSLFIIVFLISIFFAMPGTTNATPTASGTIEVCSYQAETYFDNGSLGYGLGGVGGTAYVTIYYNIKTGNWKIESTYSYETTSGTTATGNIKITDWKTKSNLFSAGHTFSVNTYMLGSSMSSINSFNCPNYAYVSLDDKDFCFSNTSSTTSCSSNIDDPIELYLNSSNLEEKLATYSSTLVDKYYKEFAEWISETTGSTNLSFSDFMTESELLNAVLEDYVEYFKSDSGLSGNSNVSLSTINESFQEKLETAYDTYFRSNLSEKCNYLLDDIVSNLEKTKGNIQYDYNLTGQVDDIDDDISTYKSLADSIEEWGSSTIGEMVVPTITKCETLLGSPTYDSTSETQDPAYYIVFAFKVIRYVAIILLIVLTIMDFLGPVTSQDQDAIKKATSKAVKRLIFCIIIWLLPSLLSIVLDWFNELGVGSDCLNNF